jgi:hypothetical protein
MDSSGPSALGAQRRLRALCARSWSPLALQRATGIPLALTSQALVKRDGITPQLARAVKVAYDRLWNQDPPCATASEEEAASHVARDAARRGWAPPQAWDDDQIDLPEGRPEQGWKPSGRTTKLAVDLVEDAEFVRQNGGYRLAGNRQVAMRLGISRDNLDQAYSRARRYAARNAEDDADREAEAG